MKKLYLSVAIAVLLLTVACVLSAQPRLAGVLSYDGQQFGGSVFRVDLPSASPNIIHSFNNTAPHRPLGGVVAANDDWLYGRTAFGLPGQYGGLYKIRKDGTGFTVLVSFTNPVGNLPMPYYHTDGFVYFTNEFDLYKIDPVTHAVNTYPLNGDVVSRNLLIDADDWVYFITSLNIQVKVKTDGTQWTELHTFNEATEGIVGLGVTEVPGDTLFGVHQYGGSINGGTIYSIKKDGTGFAVHHEFTTATGFRPQSKLIYFDGRLFGITSEGGDHNAGVLFTINTDGTGYRVLHHFETGSIPTGSVFGNISIADNGRIFGQFYQFYANGFPYYRLFKIDSSGTNFEPFFQVDQREHGHFNQDVLLDGEDIYLTTMEMGRHDGGVLSYADTSGFASSLYQFGQSLNGFRPRYGLIRGSDSKLYGVTLIGGTTGNGIVYSMNENGSGFFKVHEFADNEGYEPSGKLLEASDGKLYGVCHYGGATNTGTIYRVDKNGNNFQVIYDFQNFAEGYRPRGHLVEDENGVLYGVVSQAGGDLGAVYRINKNGTGYTVLTTLPTSSIHSPFAGLYLHGEYLYGTCTYGGPENKGGVFRIKRNGDHFQVLHVFSGVSDGVNPFTTLHLATNGKLYGTTTNGGANGYGTVFSLDTTGSNYSILRSFNDNVDGSYPQDGLIQASDGLIYGTTSMFPGAGGSIFKMNLDGSGFSTVLSFDHSGGQWPSALLDLNGMRALPVDLLTFNAQKKDKAVLVSWKTSREQTSSHFEVERSTGGDKFYTIGSVAAAGNGNTVTSYSFTDLAPMKGNNFYRLKAVDADGSFTYSRIVSLNFHNTGSVVLSPNPAPGRLHVQLPAGHTYTALSITDLSGKQLMQKSIAPASTGMYLDIQHLRAGMYVLQLSNGNEKERISFVKQ